MHARVYALAAVIVLAVVSIVASYARLCLCDDCRSQFAIFGRGDLQFCWACHRLFNRRLRRVGRRRSLLRRIFRTAA